MKTIYKYPLQITDEQTIEMPKEAKILSAQLQFNDVQVWAMVDPDEYIKEKRIIRIIGTGHPVGDDEIPELKFIDTVQMAGGKLMWHIFEVLK